MKRHLFLGKYCLLCFLSCLFIAKAIAQKDSLKVMEYNLLNFGNGCQGADSNYFKYLETIIEEANPDIIGFVKLASIPYNIKDKYGVAKIGFADSILINSFDKVQKGKYDYCTITNHAKSTSTQLLFYNKQKLGFSGIAASYANIVDFNTYKLYYRDTNAISPNDSLFIYISLFQIKAGDENELIRTNQIKGVMKTFKKQFKQLPNLICMGDFHTKVSTAPYYQILTSTDDAAYRLFEPLFCPDSLFQYPAKWDNVEVFSKYFTTSTRELDNAPNTCGTGGGAKSWFDHVFLSEWIIKNENGIKYVPHSYKTFGNDGKRFHISVKNKVVYKNTSLPQDVVEALYQMSNRYPVVFSLEVNKSGIRKTIDVERKKSTVLVKEDITVLQDPIEENLKLEIGEGLMGQEVTIEFFNEDKKSVFRKNFTVERTKYETKCKLKQGYYFVKFYTTQNKIAEYKVFKN